MKDGKFYFSIKDFLDDNKYNLKKIFILVAEYTNFNIEDLKCYDGEISGGIVPFVIYNNEFYNKGIIACLLEEDSDSILIEDLNFMNIDSSSFDNKKSLIVLLDGLSSNISTFLDNLFEIVPENTQIIGGGAGKLTFQNDPVIFTKEKMYANAAVIITTPLTLCAKIGNGWKYLEGPFLTTSSEKNILKTLNFKKAFDIYKSAVEKDSGMVFSDDNFFEIAKSHPFGIVKFDKQIIVRDPIYIDENNNMVLVGDIFQNSTINILKGDKNDLIKSSTTAVKEVLEDSKSSEKQNIILFYCISRSIFLGDGFTEELNEMRSYMKNDSTLFGALTFGEIANNGKEYISFYNKSCVVGVLC